MWDPKMSGVHLTRDIIWQRRMFYSGDKIEGEDLLIEPMFLVKTAEEEAPKVTFKEENGETTQQNTDKEDYNTYNGEGWDLVIRKKSQRVSPNLETTTRYGRVVKKSEIHGNVSVEF